MIYRVHEGDLSKGIAEGYENSYAFVALDLETTGLDPKSSTISTCSLYIPGQPVDIVLFGTQKAHNFDSMLAYGYASYIIQHAPFDMSFIYHHRDILLDRVFCTRIAEKILSPDTKHGLADLIKKYYGVEINKSRRETPNWDNPTEADFEYMCRDVVFLHDIWHWQKEELVAQQKLGLAQEAFEHLPTHVKLLAEGHSNIFGYS